MENQWQQLRAVLNGELNERDGLSGQFFNRLLYCLDDVRENATASTHFMMHCNALGHSG